MKVLIDRGGKQKDPLNPTGFRRPNLLFLRLISSFLKNRTNDKYNHDSHKDKSDNRVDVIKTSRQFNEVHQCDINTVNSDESQKNRITSPNFLFITM